MRLFAAAFYGFENCQEIYGEIAAELRQGAATRAIVTSGRNSPGLGGLIGVF